ncbi:hypothetical protein D9756_009824 [Leucocoprinus leucothites]|uniref:Uncharacterized protein n=1 Tax=Leucocoprinus leucothites TaxID=201217 RepID=A0A8H5CXL1_9AGAR|nr:hypothetical protein D9756_009824 [Leucoagaricus leucothites]
MTEVLGYQSRKAHKRKRGLQDSPVDLGKMAAAKSRLSALEEELEGIEETAVELQAIMEHVDALDEILAKAKKPRLGFSSVNEDHLRSLGVKKGWLTFTSLLEDRVANMDQITVSAVMTLCDRIQEIYAYSEPGSRMIFDTILITLAKITDKLYLGKKVAILPEMRIGPSDGIHVKNANTGFELCLTGNVDYGVLLYDDTPRNRARFLVRGAPKENVLRMAKGCFFLVEDKRLKCSALSSHVPEAVSQAIALLKATLNIEEEEGESFIYYESSAFQLQNPFLQVDTSLTELRTIISLVTEWLNVSPTSGLYRLEKLD